VDGVSVKRSPDFSLLGGIGVKQASKWQCSEDQAIAQGQQPANCFTMYMSNFFLLNLFLYIFTMHSN
jgi:hypothetical protein